MQEEQVKMVGLLKVKVEIKAPLREEQRVLRIRAEILLFLLIGKTSCLE